MFKCSMVMQQSGTAGWSELLYSNQTDPLACLASLDSLANFRAALLGSAASVTFLRIKNLSSPFQGTIKRVDKPGVSTNPVDTPWQAIFFQLIGANGGRRSYKCPGVPDAQIVNGLFAPTSTYNASVIAFQNQVAGDVWQLRIRDKSQPKLDVAGVTTTGQLSTIQAHGASVGDRMQFYRTRDTVGFAVVGQFKVLSAPDAFTLVLQGWKTGRVVTTGTVYRAVFGQEQIASYGLPTASLRRVGRPLGLVRGRRSVSR